MSSRTTYISLLAGQSTAGRIAIFHKYCCYIKYGGIITNMTLWNPWRYIIDVSICHGADVWSTDWFIICSMLKIYRTHGGLLWNPTGSQQASRGASICENHLFSHTNYIVLEKCICASNCQYILKGHLWIHHQQDKKTLLNWMPYRGLNLVQLLK